MTMLNPLDQRRGASALIAGAALALLSSPTLAQTVNIAPAGTATQSSEWPPGYPAVNGIDGRITASPSVSMTHTGNEMNAWWQVAFADVFLMREVRLVNRADCCANRLSNFRVSVFDGPSEVFGQDYYAGSGSVPSGATHVVTLPAGGVLGDRVRVQLNGFNNTGTGYLHMREVEVLADEVGAPFCNPANPTSLGAPAEIHAYGSDVAGGNPLAIVASGLPSSTVGYFLCSRTTGSAMPPASQGVLCLGGNIGRISVPVLVVGPHGRAFGRFVDTLAIPGNPPTAASAGQTWYFQAWFRDSIGGSATSNFTDAVAILFS
jgi:hypothetical protein